MLILTTRYSIKMEIKQMNLVLYIKKVLFIHPPNTAWEMFQAQVPAPVGLTFEWTRHRAGSRGPCTLQFQPA